MACEHSMQPVNISDREVIRFRTSAIWAAVDSSGPHARRDVHRARGAD